MELSKRILERALNEELTDELGYERGDPSGRGSGNSRNGTTPKRVLTDIGAVELDVPRDRLSVFEPKIVPKGVSALKRFNENVIALYASGMYGRDISKTLKRFYEVDVSTDLISKVTDAALDELAFWQAHPLDCVYPIIYIDGLVIKVRTNGTVINRCAYLPVGRHRGAQAGLGCMARRRHGSDGKPCATSNGTRVSHEQTLRRTPLGSGKGRSRLGVSRPRIEVRPAATGTLRKLDPDGRPRIQAAIALLSEDPRPPSSRRLRSRDGCRVRVGAYRVLYTVADDVLLVVVVSLGHGRDAYDR